MEQVDHFQSTVSVFKEKFVLEGPGSVESDLDKGFFFLIWKFEFNGSTLFIRFSRIWKIGFIYLCWTFDF